MIFIFFILGMKKLPFILLGLYLILFVICAINPYDRSVWRAENIPVLLTVLVLVLTYKKFTFSPFAYFLMSLWIFLHTIWGYYTFERVPFDRFNNFFWFERNMYDRVGHFIIGFYAYPLAELLYKKNLVSRKRIVLLFPICAIFTIASVYEIVERWYAVSAGWEQGIAFLGSQWDVWDAQKDMLADGLWAITSMIFFLFLHKGQKIS